MIRCVKFEELLGKGASRPFLAHGDKGEVLVVKPHAKAYKATPLFTKPLFNEYVAGSLARKIALPWPHVSIVQLVPELMTALEKAGFDLFSEWCMGVVYVAGLKPYVPPHDSKQNAAHVHNLFPDSKKHAAFYGKSIFDNWVLLQDWKYDTLQIQPNGYPIFLDASMAFGGGLGSGHDK